MYLTMETITNYLIANSGLTNKEAIFLLVTGIVFGMTVALVGQAIRDERAWKEIADAYRGKGNR